MKAWIQRKKDAHHLRVLIDGKEHQRSLGKVNANAAQATLGTVCGVIDQIERGQLTVPSDVSPIEFMLNGGKRAAPALAKLTISQSKGLYLASESEENPGKKDPRGGDPCRPAQRKWTTTIPGQRLLPELLGKFRTVLLLRGVVWLEGELGFEGGGAEIVER